MTARSPDMTNVTALPVSPPKRVIASGLFGAFVIPKPQSAGDAANAQDHDEFLDDFIAGTHSRPCGEEPPAKD